ncbi:sulfite reductase [Chromatiales bacterium (ex Bugula neritina AB1)]|nr:sulfite reductase [Chromatiales bacterium (ex Bugula neritina AB1)]
MYQYDKLDQALVDARVEEFRGQVARRLNGTLSEEEFKPLRLMNGLYLQLHAYMLRVAIPYGVISSRQLHQLASIADKYDRGYGHFTTRQNIQFNWPQLVDTPEILDALSRVQMHAIQTSGNCIRNITTDPFAGVSSDETVDPRAICELLRQWSTAMPEFSYLPRKFKFALTGARKDRAAIKFHDIGIQLKRRTDGETQADIWVGGGQGRTPRVAQLLKQNILIEDLLPYLNAIMRVYNLYGNRDNKYKARIKILLASLGFDNFAGKVEDEFSRTDRSGFPGVKQELQRIENRILLPQYPEVTDLTYAEQAFQQCKKNSVDFRNWADTNVFSHKQPGYRIAVVSLKPAGGIPGDASSDQMHLLADLAESYSSSEIRVTHRQNLVLPHVSLMHLYELWAQLASAGLAESNVQLASDIIACPGLDYCSLAKARSIPVAQQLSTQMRAIETTRDLSGMNINISGCINACGHHHVASVGILGLEKNGAETYQVTLGGRNDLDASIGKVLGPGFSAEELPGVMDRLIDTWVQQRDGTEEFSDTYDRVGKKVFSEAVYATS